MDNNRTKFKTASENAIDLMSTLGKQFVNEAIEQSEPFFDIFNSVKDEFTETKKEKKINDYVKLTGDTKVYFDYAENSQSYVFIFNVSGVNKKDLTITKKNNKVNIKCNTTINLSSIPNFEIKERTWDFTLNFDYNIENHRILVELKDGCLKINIDKPVSETESDSDNSDVFTIN